MWVLTTQRPVPIPVTPGKYGNCDAYDRYMGRWSALLATQFLDFAGVLTAGRILDVGSGTGSLTRSIAAVTAARRIVGIDPVGPFVSAARYRFGDARVSFDHGDVDNLPYRDSDFDACLAQLSFHHFSDGQRALQEMLRVTRSGGVVAACEWDSGPAMEMFHLLWDTLKAVHPQLDRQDSRHPLGGRGELRESWRRAGIKDITEIPLSVPLMFADFDDFWIPFTEGPSKVWSRLCELPWSRRQDFERELKRKLLSGKTDGPINLRAQAWAVRGEVP